MTTSSPKLRWFQYSLRTLLVVVTLCALLCSWLAVAMRQARRERQAAAAFEELGGQASWYEPPDGTRWLRSRLGDHFLGSIHSVNLANSKITGAGLENLKVLDQLQNLDLYGTQVTDAGLENLKGHRLRNLDLRETKVTDAGLESLKGLNLLSNLRLGTQVTDAGLENLKGLTELHTLGLNKTQVTDAGLEHLQGLDRLRYLDLRDTKVTDAGVMKLQQALPNCNIAH